MKLRDKFLQGLEAAHAKGDAYRRSNAALASNLTRQEIKNLARKLGAQEVKLNGCPTFIRFPDHSQVQGVLPV
jgi:hypothetical protein